MSFEEQQARAVVMERCVGETILYIWDLCTLRTMGGLQHRTKAGHSLSNEVISLKFACVTSCTPQGRDPECRRSERLLSGVGRKHDETPTLREANIDRAALANAADLLVGPVRSDSYCPRRSNTGRTHAAAERQTAHGLTR